MHCYAPRAEVATMFRNFMRLMTDEQLQNTRALAQEQAEQEAKAAQKVQEDMLAQADIVEISIDEIMAARKEIPAGKKQARNAPANRKNANVVNVVNVVKR